MSKSSPCPVCTKQGLAVLPSRYTVAPDQLDVPTGHFTCPEIVAIPVPGYKYTARILRPGFLYVFYKKNHLGANKWDVYSVSAEGKLHKQLGTEAACFIDKEEVCSRCGSASFNKDFFVIEHPEKCGDTWLAFSEHKWTEETVRRYQSDEGLRSKRMQKIDPSGWLNAPKAGPYTKILAIESNIECIAEYYGESTNEAVLHSELSTEDGGYLDGVLKSRHTAFPWFMRNGVNSNLVKPHPRLLAQMQQASPNPDGGEDRPHYYPMLVALWDAVGIARELNGGLNDLLGNAVRYQDERAMQIDAANAIGNMEEIFKARAAFTVDRSVAGSADLANRQVEERTRYFIENRLSPRERGILDEHRPLYDRYRASEIGWNDYLQERSRIIERHVKPENMHWPASLWLSVEERRQVIEDGFRTNDAARRRNTAGTWDTLRSERLPGETRQSLARWASEYKPLFDSEALATFNRNYARFQEEVTQGVEDRVQPLLTWLQAPLLLDTLEDYDQAMIGDGVAFEEVVGSCMQGLTCTEGGGLKVDEWIKQAQAARDNLVWRGVLLNQREAIDEANPLLASAMTDSRIAQKATVDELIKNIKLLQRTADVFKKAHTTYNAILDAGVASEKGTATVAFGIALRQSTALGLDRIMTLFGSGLYKALPSATRTVDLIGEKTLHALFLLRAGVAAQDVENLIHKQAVAAAEARGQAVLDLRRDVAGVPRANPPPAVEDLRRAWANFKASGTEGSARAIRDVRLATVVGLMEGANLAKLTAQSEGDLRARSLIAASMLGISAAVMDVASVPAKSV